jgi:ActR/RegA family two-component response regulator
MKGTILIVADASHAVVWRDLMVTIDYSVVIVDSWAGALDALYKYRCDLAVAVLQFGEGIEDLLGHVLTHSPKTLVIAAIEQFSLHLAVEAMRKGAYDYIIIPANSDVFRLTVERAIERKRLSDAPKIIEGSLEPEGTNCFVRFIEFPPEYYQAGVSILTYFGTILRKRYPDKKSKVRIEQQGLKVIMTVESLQGENEKDVFERSFEEYGLVIKGVISPEEFAQDPLLVADLKQEINMARTRIETQKELVRYKDAEIARLFSLVGRAIEHSRPSDFNIQVSPRIETHISQSFRLVPQVSLVQGTLNELKEQLPAGSEEVAAIEDVQSGLDRLKHGSLESIRESPVMSKIRRFVKDLDNVENKVGQALRRVQNGMKFAQELAEQYNTT